MILPVSKYEGININLCVVPVVILHNCQYFGLNVDDELNWKQHIDYLKLIKFVGIFYKIINKLPSSVLKTIYFAFVHRHLLYGIELYANTATTNLHKLIILNNRLLVTSETTSALQYKLCMIMYTIHFGLAPLYITELVSTVAAQTSRPGLRSADTTNYVQPPTRTEFGKRAFSYAGPAVWNSLPDNLRRSPTINSFKRKLNTYLFISAYS